MVRLVYQSVYCLEICFRGGRLVAIRDGSYSRFDRNLIEEFNPIQGLKVHIYNRNILHLQISSYSNYIIY